MKSIPRCMSFSPDRHPHVQLTTMPYRCPACQHFRQQQPHFVAHPKLRKQNCKGGTSYRR